MRRPGLKGQNPACAALLRRLIVLVALLGCAPPAFAQPDGAQLEGKTVKRIDFVGLELYTKKAVMARMQTQEGRAFSRKGLEDDLRTLAGHTARAIAPPGDPNQPPPEAPPLPPKVFSVMLAGGGVKGGLIHGTSNATASEPDLDPVGPGDLATTMYHQLGIVADKELMAPGDRPIEIVDGGKLVKPLIS